MRILWVSQLVPYPAKGGVQQRSYNLLRELSRYHEVTFTGFQQAAHQPGPEELREAIGAMAEFCTVGPVLPVPSDSGLLGRPGVAALAWARGASYTVDWLRSGRFKRLLRELFVDTRPQVVHFDTISLAPYATCTPGAARSMTHHNIESDMLVRRSGLAANPVLRGLFALEAARLRSFESQHCPHFDLNIVCSELDRARLLEIAPGCASQIVPNGVDTDYFQPNPAPGPREPDSLVFAGRMNWYPNDGAMRWFFDDIWPLLVAARPGIRITVVGKNPGGWLQRLATRDERVTVTGFVDDVRPYLERAMVYVCPIFDGGGTKLKVLDACAMGCAIVAHPVACEGLDGLTDEHVATGAEPAAFAAAVLGLLDAPEQRERMGRSARQLMQARYAFTMIGKSLADAYSALGATGPQRR